MIKVLVGAQKQLRCKIVLCDEVTELFFFRMAHAAWIYNSGLSALLIVEDVRIFLYGSEGELLYLKHRMVKSNRIKVMESYGICRRK